MKKYSKTLITVFVILVVILIIGILGFKLCLKILSKEPQNSFTYFEKDFNISLNNSNVISELDEIYFFGDGTFFQVIEIDSQIKDRFNNWENFTFEKYKRILKYNENNSITSRYNEKVIIPDIKNGKSIFLNRNYDDPEWHSSHNFSFAIYDIDNSLLYYLVENS